MAALLVAPLAAKREGPKKIAGKGAVSTELQSLAMAENNNGEEAVRKAHCFPKADCHKPDCLRPVGRCEFDFANLCICIKNLICEKFGNVEGVAERSICALGDRLSHRIDAGFAGEKEFIACQLKAFEARFENFTECRLERMERNIEEFFCYKIDRLRDFLCEAIDNLECQVELISCNVSNLSCGIVNVTGVVDCTGQYLIEALTVITDYLEDVINCEVLLALDLVQCQETAVADLLEALATIDSILDGGNLVEVLQSLLGVATSLTDCVASALEDSSACASIDPNILASAFESVNSNYISCLENNAVACIEDCGFECAEVSCTSLL